MKLIIFCFLFILSMSLIHGEILRISGSNQNSLINSAAILPFDPPQFGENITISANVTDDNNTISWVNFTLINPNNLSVINNENATTVVGDIWNSSTYLINNSGGWSYNITSSDDDLTNTTSDYLIASFNITDDLYYSPSTLSTALLRNQTASYTISLYTSTREPLNYSVFDNFDGNITVNINDTSITINSTKYTKIKINISSTLTSVYGIYYGNITFSRNAPFNRTWNISVVVEVSTSYGNIEFQSPSDTIYKSCADDITHTATVINNGNYQLTNCHPHLYNESGDEVSTSSFDFTLAVNATTTAKVKYNFLAQNNTVTYFGVNCTATPNGSIDTTSNDPKIEFHVGDDCVSSRQAGTSEPGGPSAPRSEEIIYVNVTKPFCGDDICQDNETPWDCWQDCRFDFDMLFDFSPTGAWRQAWFATLIIYGLLGLSLVAIARRQMAATKKRSKPVKPARQNKWLNKGKLQLKQKSKDFYRLFTTKPKRRQRT